MKFKLFIYFVLYSVTLLAIDSNNINHNLYEIKNKINQVNLELTKKQEQQQNINQALKTSEEAINQSSLLLNKLKNQKQVTQQQLNSIQDSLNQVEQSINNTKISLQGLIKQIYQQIQSLKIKQQSILSGNGENEASRKKTYLIAILKYKEKNLQILQNKIDTLTLISNNLQKKITILNTNLGNTITQQKQQQTDKQQNLQKSQKLQYQITQDEEQINRLKEQQAKLNYLMKQIIASEVDAKERKQHNQKIKSLNQNSEQATNDNYGYDNNSPFFSRKVTKPINAKIAIGFGVIRDNVANKGILFDYTEHLDIKSVSDGKVMFAGNVPSFGKVIIIDHGNDYMSVYSGIINYVKAGEKILAGQIIANSGNKDNQPLGGVYFELRHLGKPINPNKLFN